MRHELAGNKQHQRSTFHARKTRAQYVYPYLLRNVKPAYPNHVWGIDITYVAMQGRWMYLVPIIDWYSRAVVGHELAHTMNKEFVIKAVDDAVRKHGTPVILNSDQGSKFTSPAYINKLKENGINILVWTVKVEPWIMLLQNAFGGQSNGGTSTLNNTKHPT